jgi:hypothetical protein
MELKKPPDKPVQYMKCIKTSLKNITKSDNTIKILTEKVNLVHKIAIHTLHFIKLYTIDFYNKSQKFQTIDEQFILEVMKVICVQPTGLGGLPNQDTLIFRKLLQQFYNDHYKELQGTEQFDREHLLQILQYLAIEILTSYKNNARQHFVDYMERYINVVWKKTQLIEIIRKKLGRTQKEKEKIIRRLCRSLSNLKKDLLDPTGQYSDYMYDEWITEERKKVIPQRPLVENLFYDLQKSPEDYLPCMFYMMRKIEEMDETMLNIFPLRTTIIPGYMTLDTASLIRILGVESSALKNIGGNKQEVWSRFFKTNKRCFKKKGYEFHGMIKTDGVGACVILHGIGIKKPSKIPKKDKLKQETYVSDEMSDNELNLLQGKKIVAIDPNMADLLYCIDEDGETFRYTQNQRRKETQQKRYRNILQRNKKTVIQGKTVEEWEAELSLLNRKTLDFDGFKEYVRMKNKVNLILQTFYESFIYRKHRLYTYIDTQRSESKMINNFTAKYGPADKLVACFGDWNQHQHRNNHEPVKGKGFRTTFRRAGIKVLLVDEHRTSLCCSDCQHDDRICKKFKVIDNPRPKKNDKILCHGLVRCTTCSRLWNRDKNAASNIFKIAHAHINGHQRPHYLRRGK